jgi:Arc/MetJ-type ribon-helix-helix transcriptional regulator
MAKNTRKPSAPITFDLTESLIARIEVCRRGHGLSSASDVVRAAIEAYDFDGCVPDRDPHRQISVRIPVEQRTRLRRHAKIKDASVGELLRLALESLPTKPGRRKS